MRLGPLVLLALLIVGCTSAASTTTSSVISTTSSTHPTQSLVPGGLIQVDPATLVPYEDAEPIVVGHSHRGVVSSNGDWAAIVTERAGEDIEVSIVDLDDLEVDFSTTGGPVSGLVVDDAGTAAWFDEGRLRGFSADIEFDAHSLPGPVDPALAESLSILDDGRVVYLKTGEGGDGVTIVSVDATGPSEITVDGVATGPTAGTDPDLPSRDFIAPAVGWDDQNNRALIVSATSNDVIEVDLSTGESRTHPFQGPNDPGDQGVGRDVFTSATGDVLLIATRTLTVDGGPGNWTAVDTAEDLVSVDTVDWSSQLNTQSAWALQPSLDDRYVAAMGATITWGSDGEESVLQSPVYLVDGNTGEPLVGFEGRSGGIADTQFSGDAAEMYVISESEDGTNIDIVDVASQGLAGSLAFTRISLIGEAGLISFHSTE